MTDARELGADELLQALLTGDLSAEAAEVAERLAGEPQLALRWRELSNTTAAVDDALRAVRESAVEDGPQPERPAIDLAACMARAGAGRRARRGRWLVAAALLLVGLGFLVRPWLQPTDPLLGTSQVTLEADGYTRFGWRTSRRDVDSWVVIVFDAGTRVEVDRSGKLRVMQWEPGAASDGWPPRIYWEVHGLDDLGQPVARGAATTGRR